MITFKNTTFKKILLSCMQLLSFGLLAQSPSLINYQGAARLADGTPLGNRTVSIKFDLHQGSPSGSVVASEVQTLQTNLLGLFTTQVGKNTSLAGINWQGNTMFLQVSIDTSAGSNFTSLGAQQLVSVPYAMHASSVPASYANNILTIGSTTIALSPTLAVTPNTSITLSGLGSVSSSGTNTFDINIPTPSFTNAGPTTITGSYPNYTVNSTTGVTYTNGTGIAITSGTIINTSPNITPSIAVTNTVAAASSVAGSGSSFSINVPPPTFTNAGPATITGAYPNYTINSPAATSYSAGTGIAITSGTIINTAPNITPTVAITTTAAAGASVTSAGNSFSLNVPAPTFTNTGQQIITGTYPNFSVNTPTVPGTVTPSIAVTTTAAAGASVTSSGSTFSINVPPPAFTNSGQQIITGTYPNFTVNTPSVIAGTGISVASGSVITNTAPDVAVAFSNSGQNIVTGTYPNFTVNTPTTSVSAGTGISVASGSVITNTAPDVTVAFTNSGQNIVTGTYPNFTVNTPTVSVSAGTGISVASGSVITNTAPDVIVTFTNSGQNIVTGTYPNFTVNTPTVAATAITGSGLVSAIGGPNYTLNVQSPVFTNSGQNIITGTYPNYSVNTPSLTASLSSSAGTSPSLTTNGNGFNLNIPPSNDWSLLGNAGTSTVTNFIGTTDNVPLVFRVAGVRSGIIDQGLSNAYFGYLSGSSNTSGSLNTGFGQEALKGVTTSNRNSAFGYQSLIVNTSGASNTGIGASTLKSNTTGSDNTALGKDALFGNITGSSNLGIGSGALLTHTGGDNNIAIGRDALNGNVSGANNAVLGHMAGYLATGSSNVFVGYGAGYNETGSNKFYLANTSTSVSPLLFGDFSTGKLSINSVSGNGVLSIDNQSVTTRDGIHIYNARDQVGSGMPLWINAVTSGQTYGGSTYGRIIRMENTTLGYFYDMGIGSTSNFFLTNSNNLALPAVNISTLGNVGISTPAPTANFHVNGTTRLVDGTQGAGKVLSSDATGNATWVNSAINTGFSAYANTNQSVPNNIYTNVTFGGEDYDDGNNFSGSAYVCPTAGVYHFDASVSWNGMNTGTGWVHAVISVNGTVVKYTLTQASTGFFSTRISADIKCTSGASIQVKVYQQQSGNEDIYGLIGYTYFTGHRIY